MSTRYTALLGSATQHAMSRAAECGKRSVSTLVFLCLPYYLRDTTWSWKKNKRNIIWGRPGALSVYQTRRLWDRFSLRGINYGNKKERRWVMSALRNIIKYSSNLRRALIFSYFYAHSMIKITRYTYKIFQTYKKYILKTNT